jgi:hypothetical protein
LGSNRKPSERHGIGAADLLLGRPASGRIIRFLQPRTEIRPERKNEKRLEIEEKR